MTRPLPPRFDYHCHIASVTDGDTVRALLTRVIDHDDDFTATIRTRDGNGVPIRLLWVDTPERSDTDAWRAARIDTASWLAAHAGQLRCETHGRDNLNRTLGDIYVTGDRGNTLSQHLIRDRGWLPFVEGK